VLVRGGGDHGCSSCAPSSLSTTRTNQLTNTCGPAGREGRGAEAKQQGFFAWTFGWEVMSDALRPSTHPAHRAPRTTHGRTSWGTRGKVKTFARRVSKFCRAYHHCSKNSPKQTLGNGVDVNTWSGCWVESLQALVTGGCGASISLRQCIQRTCVHRRYCQVYLRRCVGVVCV
jgi:hypothetical protein